MTNKEIIQNFYYAFATGNASEMISYYHEEIIFEDPAFGVLKGDKAKNMWKMLLSNKDSKPKIEYSNIEADDKMGRANWVAEYIYGPQKRNVINKISAEFEFANGKIIKHTDRFNLWKWTQQALGTSGLLLGWTPFMKSKIQKTTNKALAKFMAKNQ